MKPVPGLHRVPGDTRVVAECASRYDEREDAPLRGVRDARAVASVLKLYLDALPTPLLRAKTGPGAAAGNAPAFPATVAAVAETRRERGHDAALAALRAFVANGLPVCNRDALRATCAHLRRVAQAEAAAETLRDADSVAARRRFAEATKTLAAAFGKTLCGESLGSAKAVRSVVEMLLEHHDAVFGTRAQGSVKTTVKTTATATATATRGKAEKENAVPVADVRVVSPTKKTTIVRRDADADPDADADADDAVSVTTAVVEKGISSYVDGATLDVVRGFLFDGDDGVCAEADRALGGSIQSLYADGDLLERSVDTERLRREKTAIKRRLRAFDVSVERSSGMKSTKEDKKHLRPLYLRLARVKRRMQIVAAESEA